MTPPTLLLLHGLGATNGVWAGVLEEISWPGPVVMPDLAGHGRSKWTGDYSVGGLAAHVSGQLDPDSPLTVVGHSLGGGVGLCLASGFFRPRVVGVLGLGIKTEWTDDDVEAMEAVADRGIRWYTSHTQAADRFLRQAGLVGLIESDHPAINDAVVETTDGWRVAQDPATFAQKKLDMAGLVGAATCQIILGAGADDQMVNASDLARYVPEPRIAANMGHNVHVQDPTWVIELITELAGTN